MSNLTRKENGNSQNPQLANVWEPFRLMENMLGWNPFAMLHPAHVPTAAQNYMPRFDVKETQDCYVFTADLPGIREEDLDVSLTGNRLVISGKRESEECQESEQYHLHERSYGRFSRAFSLPDCINPDQVKAHLKDGVLTLTVGKKTEVQPRRIQISSKPVASA